LACSSRLSLAPVYAATEGDEQRCRSSTCPRSGSSYETSAQVNKGELDGQKAFTQGKVKIGGKMLKMMQLRGPLAQVQVALATIDTAY
jgi:SCP-2 sterol transfer family